MAVWAVTCCDKRVLDQPHFAVASPVNAVSLAAALASVSCKCQLLKQVVPAFEASIVVLFNPAHDFFCQLCTPDLH